MSKIKASTSFINIMVKVSGKPGDYVVVTAPAVPYLTQPDTVLNFQLYDSPDPGVIFVSATYSPEDNGQLSAYTISPTGKNLSLIDANTKKMGIGITLAFQDSTGATFLHDPQVQNVPEL
jgi:hypothetical protein